MFLHSLFLFVIKKCLLDYLWKTASQTVKSSVHLLPLHTSPGPMWRIPHPASFPLPIGNQSTWKSNASFYPGFSKCLVRLFFFPWSAEWIPGCTGCLLIAEMLAKVKALICKGDKVGYQLSISYFCINKISKLLVWL